MAISKYIKNVSGTEQHWRGVVISNNTSYQIPDIEDKYWRNDSDVIQAITDEDAQMSFDNTNWMTGTCALGFLKMIVSHSCGTCVEDSHTPSSASDGGVPGTICWDSNYIYICVAANTWKRAAISSWS